MLRAWLAALYLRAKVPTLRNSPRTRKKPGRYPSLASSDGRAGLYRHVQDAIAKEKRNYLVQKCTGFHKPHRSPSSNNLLSLAILLLGGEGDANFRAKKKIVKQPKLRNERCAVSERLALEKSTSCRSRQIFCGQIPIGKGLPMCVWIVSHDLYGLRLTE